MRVEFTSTDIQRKSPEVFDSARKGPIAITRQGDSEFTLMTTKHYKELQGLSYKPDKYNCDGLVRAEWIAWAESVYGENEVRDYHLPPSHMIEK
jgi:prevent-host-death family protein